MTEPKLTEVTWEVEDSEGETECGCVEVEEATITVAALREYIVDDFDERSGSFEDYAKDAARVRIRLDDLWIELPSTEG